MKGRRTWSRRVVLVLCSAVLCACVPAGALAADGPSAETAVTIWQVPQPALAAIPLPRTGDGAPLLPVAALGACAAACIAGAGTLMAVAKGGSDDGGGS